MTTIVSMAAARAKKTQHQAVTAAFDLQVEDLEDRLMLTAHYFNKDSAGRCTDLTAAGFAYYRPLFAEQGARLNGTETFRQMQAIKSDILEAHTDKLENTLRREIQTGKIQGSEMKIALALLDGNIQALPGTQRTLTCVH
ncbi:MAG: hypothetical protein ACYC3W_07035 [Candidatus Nanopelagicales bacterium]